LWNYITCSFNNDFITDIYTERFNLFWIMKAGTGDSYATYINRI